MSFSSNLGEINLGEFNLGDLTVGGPPTGTIAISFDPLFSIFSYTDITGEGDLSFGYSFLLSGWTASVYGTLGLIFNLTIQGISKYIYGSGDVSFDPAFALDGNIEYSLGNLTYEFSLALIGVETISGSIGFAIPFALSISGTVYESNQDLVDELYLRRYLNDTVGLSRDQSPVAITYDEIPDAILNLITDY